jgi:hypothetical protein
VQPLDHVADGRGERLPPVVRLGSVHEEVWRPRVVGQQPHDEPRCVVLLVVVAHERHRRPACPVVVELVDLERRHDPPAARLVDEVARGDRRRVPRIQEPVEDEHHRDLGHTLELGHVVDDVDQPFGIGHGNLSDRGLGGASSPSRLFRALGVRAREDSEEGRGSRSVG